MNRPRWSPWIDGSTIAHAGDLVALGHCWHVLCTRLRSFDVDLAVVADHQAQRPRSQAATG